MRPLHTRTRTKIWGDLGVFCGLFGLAGPMAAQETPPTVTPPAVGTPTQAQPIPQAAVNFRERPKYPADPARLRRTPTIDGVLSEGEWDPFYTITDGAVKGTVYCHWDDEYLYLAARTDAPATLLFDLDASGDGWLRGKDNLEIVVGAIEEGKPASVEYRLLDAASSKDSPVWNSGLEVVKGLRVVGKLVNGAQVVEIGIPKSTASLVLREGAQIGLRAEFLPPGAANSYTPTAPFEPHLLLDATLTLSRALGIPGVNPVLTLSDTKVVPGQKLFATIEMLNQTDRDVPLKAVQFSGQGASYDVLNTLRDLVVGPIPAQKRYKYTYRTVIPENVPPGTYTLDVVAEVEGGRQARAAATFTVVEPMQAQVGTAPDPVAVIGPTTFSLNVDVFGQAPNGMRGDIELLNLPAGWEVKGGAKRGFSIDRADARKVTGFTIKLPSDTPAGDYPIEAVVTGRGQTLRLKYAIKVVRPNGAIK